MRGLRRIKDIFQISIGNIQYNTEWGWTKEVFCIDFGLKRIECAAFVQIDLRKTYRLNRYKNILRINFLFVSIEFEINARIHTD